MYVLKLLVSTSQQHNEGGDVQKAHNSILVGVGLKLKFTGHTQHRNEW